VVVAAAERGAVPASPSIGDYSASRRRPATGARGHHRFGL